MSENTKEKQRVLIVDDSKVIRVTARKILRDHFETVEAVDGEDAWELLAGEETFSLVVSDLTMPRLDGFGLLERIRSSHLPQVRELPVIIITGANDSEATMERARSAGATDFIGKPFDAVHLLARTQAHASAHAATNTLMEENTALEETSSIDSTTGLCNETCFMERGYQQLSYAIRHGSNLAMFRIEIDSFGELFQRHGETLTESVIREMGKTLTTVIRQEDTAARTGTARFSLLLPGMNQNGIRNLAERINQKFTTYRFMSGDTRVPVTISVGVGAPDIRRNTRFEELLTIADERLARAVKQGGNQIVYEEASPMPSPGMPEAALAEADTEAKGFPAEFMLEDLEEIELSHVDLPGYILGADKNNIPTIEGLAPGTAEPAGDRFAGPVPDGQIGLIPAGASGHVATNDQGPPESHPAVTANNAAGLPAGEKEADSILISAPYSAHTIPMPEAWTANEASVTAGSGDDAPDSADSADGAAAGAGDPDTVPRRKGFFRKMLGLFAWGLVVAGLVAAVSYYQPW
jgi:diguanylate cyclase (GGDEF)-like protein